MIQFNNTQIRISEMSADLQQKYLNQNYTNKFLINYCKWAYEEFLSKDWNQFFVYIHNLACQFMSFKGQFIQIPKHILMPSYSNMFFLRIRHTQITSIESLAFLNAPTLLRIDISDNRITTLKSLNKIQRPINHLSLTKNLIISFSFERICIVSQFGLKMQNNFQPDWVANQDFNLLAKLQCHQVSSLEANSDHRVYQWKVNRVLQQKYSTVKFF